MAKPLSRFILSNLIKRSMNAAGFKTIAVEGNIASGKTECLRYFQERYGAKICAEPINKWRNLGGHNLFDLMYTDPGRWSLTFQTYVQLTMLRSHTKNDLLEPGDTKFMERSIYSAKYCFVENLFRTKKMSEVEYLVLTEWFDWIIENVNCHIDLIIYLRTTPDVVYDRLVQRSRPEERHVPLDYLKTLHGLHEDWLISKTFPVTGEVITIDANADLENLHSRYDVLAKEIFSDEGKPVIVNGLV